MIRTRFIFPEQMDLSIESPTKFSVGERFLYGNSKYVADRVIFDISSEQRVTQKVYLVYD